MRPIAKFAGLVLSLVLPFSASYAADKPLRIGIEASFEPFAYKTPEGQIAGFDYDIGNALCAEMKVKCQWVELEFDGLIPALKVRKIDAILSSMSITEERKRSVDFTGKYYSSPARLAMKAGSEIKDPLVDLKGRKVGVLRSSVYDRYATEALAPAGVEIVRYTSQNEVYLDLAAGRIDATLADVLVLDGGFLKSDAGKSFALVGPEFNDKTFLGEGQGIAVRKSDTALRDKISAAILALRANGTYQKIQDKYFSFNIYGE